MNSMIDDKYNRYYENKEKKTWKFHKKMFCLYIVFLNASNRHLRFCSEIIVRFQSSRIKDIQFKLAT